MNIVRNKLADLWELHSNKGTNWNELVVNLQKIEYCNKLNFAHEVLFTKLIDKLGSVVELTVWEVRNILYILSRSGLDIFNFSEIYVNK